jgi:hypothetical protein
MSAQHLISHAINLVAASYGTLQGLLLDGSWLKSGDDC